MCMHCFNQALDARVESCRRRNLKTDAKQLLTGEGGKNYKIEPSDWWYFAEKIA